NGAPFPLVTYEDTQVLANGVPLWKFMRAVVQSGAMPLPPVQIDSSQRDVLLAWFDAGAPSRPALDMCSDLVDSSVDGADADAVPDEGGGDEGDAGADRLEGGSDATETGTPEAGALDGGAPESDAPTAGDAADCADLDACTAAGDDAQPE